jgi:hypothetical protein
VYATIGFDSHFLDIALSSYNSAALTRSKPTREGLDGVIAAPRLRGQAGNFKVRRAKWEAQVSREF